MKRIVKHTPWHLVTTQEEHIDSDDNVIGEYQMIYLMSGNRTLFSNELYRATLEEFKLAAAAPEMLKALKQAHLDIVTFLNEGDFKRRVVWDASYIVDVIEKAEGRSK